MSGHEGVIILIPPSAHYPCGGPGLIDINSRGTIFQQVDDRSNGNFQDQNRSLHGVLDTSLDSAAVQCNGGGKELGRYENDVPSERERGRSRQLECEESRVVVCPYLRKLGEEFPNTSWGV